MNRVHEAIKNVLNHDVFKSILESAPLSIAQGAHQAPCEGHDFEEAMKTGTYSCSGNFFWQDLVWLANHRVPVSLRQIKQFQQFSFPAMNPPDTVPFTVTVCTSTEKPGCKSWGKFQRISPEEPVHAMLFSLEEAVLQAPGDDALMGKWLKLVLTTPFVFEKPLSVRPDSGGPSTSAKRRSRPAIQLFDQCGSACMTSLA